MIADKFLKSSEKDPFLGTQSFAYVMPSEVSIDIDTENDWFIAEQLMRMTIS